jgi:hypothetical protein
MFTPSEQQEFFGLFENFVVPPMGRGYWSTPMAAVV